MDFPRGMIKCSLLLQLCWACGCPSKVMTALSETWESPKLIPQMSVSWRVIEECLSITAAKETQLNALSWLTRLYEFRLSIFNLFCVWLHIAHICHLLLWRSCYFLLRCHWALTTAKSGFRETSHQNTWRAKNCHYNTDGAFLSVASKNGFQLSDAAWSRQRYCTSDFSSRIRSVSYIDGNEFGISPTAAWNMSPCSSSQAI